MPRSCSLDVLGPLLHARGERVQECRGGGAEEQGDGKGRAQETPYGYAARADYDELELARQIDQAEERGEKESEGERDVEQYRDVHRSKLQSEQAGEAFLVAEAAQHFHVVGEENDEAAEGKHQHQRDDETPGDVAAEHARHHC